MGGLCALGWYAWKQDMNITYICLWGLGCFVNGIFDTLGIIVPIIFNVLTLQILEICLRALVPASELLGSAFAWHLYLDYYNHGGGASNEFMHGVAGSMPDPMGKLVDEVDPEEYKSLTAGLQKQGEAFQKEVDSGAVTQQLKKGGQAMQQGVGQISEQLQGQFGQLQQQLPQQQQEQQPEMPPPTAMRSQKQAPCC